MCASRLEQSKAPLGLVVSYQYKSRGEEVKKVMKEGGDN